MKQHDVADWLKCDFMQDQVGQTFTGLITSVTGFGFFVRLNDLLDGLVHISTLDNDYYRYDAVGQRLVVNHQVPLTVLAMKWKFVLKRCIWMNAPSISH